MMLQVTNNAIYALGDTDELALWVVNATTQKPSTNLPVLAGTTQLKTDMGGVLRMPLTHFATSTSSSTTAGDFILAEIGADSDISFYFKSRVQFDRTSPYNWSSSPSYDYWTYLFIDRPIYRPTDELAMYGFIQHRDSHKGPGEVTIKLQKQGAWWLDFFGKEKVYQEQKIQTDASGHFQTQLSWADLSPGYYQVNVYTGDLLIGSRFFEVRDYIKPAFSIDLTLQEERIYAGESVKGSIDVRFYDGTPLSKGGYIVEMGSYQGNATSVHVTTDENGHAVFSLPTVSWDCAITDPNVSCPSNEFRTITARSTQGEEAEIVGSANVSVFASSISIDLFPHTSGTDARVDVVTRHVDLEKDQLEGGVWGQRIVKGFIVGHDWKRLEDGSYYDFFEKKTIPRYRYEQVNDTPVEFQITTDAAGKANHAFKMEGQKWYDIILMGTDDQRRVWRSSRSLSRGWYDQAEDVSSVFQPENLADDLARHLAFVPEMKDLWSPGTFRQDDVVKVQYQQGKQRFDTSRTAGTLYVTASRGLRTIQYVNSADYEFRLDRDLIPNATIRGIAFVNHRFEVMRRDLALNTDSHLLDIEAKPIQPSHLPGGEVKIHVTMTKHGTTDRVPGKRIQFAAVDKALEGISSFPEELPLSMIYGYVPDGVTIEEFSHLTGTDISAMAGAEKGGGGGGPDAPNVRRTFKDTASFGVVTTDQNGEADVIFKAPDNLTTWRVQLVSITDDVKAGSVLIQVPVTKPLFVDIVAPPQLLTHDKPIIKLRAYGVGLMPNEPITFNVNAPSLGIRDQAIQGTAYTPLSVAVDQLVPGRHAIIVRITTAKGTDALERILDIADTRYYKDEQVVMNGVANATLPDLGTSEVDLTFASQAQASFLPQIRELASFGWSARVDAKIVSRMMKKLLRDVYKEKGVDRQDEDGFYAYIDLDAGIRLLPYASTDPELTAEVASTAPEMFDQNAFKGYFYKILDDPSSTRQLQIMALAGLSSLREPVLLQLQKMSMQPDLSWREQLVIARGLFAAGDQEGAKTLLQALLKKAEHRDNVTHLPVSAQPGDIYEATSDAAALAVQLALPEAENLQRYVTENWSQDSYPLLAKARYMAWVVPRTPTRKVSMDYSIDGKTERHIDLTEHPVFTETLTREEARAFRVVRVQGPLSISFVKRLPGRPETKPEIAVTRTYVAEHPLDQLQEGDMIRVTLKAAWQVTAQDGCYALRDHLPGGWQPVFTLPQTFITPEDGTSNTYPYDVKAREVSFVVCKDKKEAEIHYVTRVVSRGTYTAEAPSLQHLQFPSVSAIGVDQTVVIK